MKEKTIRQKIREEKKYQGNNLDNEPVYSIYNILYRYTYSYFI